MNLISQTNVMIAAAYAAPKICGVLKSRTIDQNNPSILDNGTRLCQCLESQTVNLLGEKNWSYLVNVYGDNFWIALAGLTLLTHNQRAPNPESLETLLSTYALGLAVIPAFAYGIRFSIHRCLPPVTQAIADFVKPKE